MTWHGSIARSRGGDRFESRLNTAYLIYVKNGSYYCYVRCATFIVRVGGKPWPKNRRNSLPCTVMTSGQSSCNQRVGWRMGATTLIPWVFGRKRRDLAPLINPGLLDLALKCHWQQPRPYEEVTFHINSLYMLNILHINVLNLLSIHLT